MMARCCKSERDGHLVFYGAMIALWAASVYLRGEKKSFWFTLAPAVFMTAVSVSYFFAAPECLGSLWPRFGLAYSGYYPAAICVGAAAALGGGFLFLRRAGKS